ncbi:MAG: urease accessory UreF family protein [Pseudomonadota bacterium]
MTSPGVLAAMQLADSAFPSGAFAYSWGLEAALADGRVDRRGFAAWLEAEMLGRWAPFDRVALAMAHRAAEAGGDPADVDREIDLAFWAEPLRARSAEAGQAFLGAAARLGDGAALALREAALAGEAPGHLPAAQGAVFRSMGLDLALALAASAHGAAQSLASAAVRLSLIGALDAQRALIALRPALAEAAGPPPPDQRPAAFSPLAEIAQLRPPPDRLFIN